MKIKTKYLVIFVQCNELKRPWELLFCLNVFSDATLIFCYLIKVCKYVLVPWIGDNLHIQTCTKFSRYCATNSQTHIKSCYKHSKTALQSQEILSKLFPHFSFLVSLRDNRSNSHCCDIHTGSWDTESRLLW